jgi:hypothetical protein
MRPAWGVVIQDEWLSVVNIIKSTARNRTVQPATIGGFWMGF